MSGLQRLDNWLFSDTLPKALTLPVGGPCYLYHSCGEWVIDANEPIPPYSYPLELDPNVPKSKWFSGVMYWQVGVQRRIRECERCGWRRRVPWPLLEKEIDQLIAGEIGIYDTEYF